MEIELLRSRRAELQTKAGELFKRMEDDLSLEALKSIDDEHADVYRQVCELDREITYHPDASFSEQLDKVRYEGEAAIPSLVDQSPPGGSQVGTEHHEKRAAAMREAILHRTAPSQEPSDAAREYVGASLIDMARECLEMQGDKTRGLTADEIAARALSQRSGAYGSSSDFPSIITSVMHTTLRTAYEAAGQTFRPLVNVVEVPDFKLQERAQLGEGPGFERVDEHGEFPRGTPSDHSESYQIATYGRILSFSRQALVNDEWNCLLDAPRRFGAAAAQLESDLVWAQILGNPALKDGTPLLHSSRGNVAPVSVPLSSPSALAAILAGATAMRKRRGVDGMTVLNLRPKALVVGVGQEDRAAQLLGDEHRPHDALAAVPDSLRDLQVIAEPRFDNGINRPELGIEIAPLADAWLLAAVESWACGVELAYLEGNRGVYTETRYGFDVDGVEVKGRLDVGAAAIDWRPLHRGN